MWHRLFLIPAALLAGTSASRSVSNENGAFVFREVGQAAPAAPRYTVRAGPVANAKASELSGSFQVLETGAPSGIPSSRLGGSCLVFAAADLGYSQMAAKQCQKSSDCSTPGENELTYCEPDTKTCWSKPVGPAADAALCNKGKIFPVADLNPVPQQPVNVGAFGIEVGAKVRVVACINKSGANPGLTGCGSMDGADKLEVFGPVAIVK